MSDLYPYTSIRHTARGFNFQSDFQSVGQWEEATAADHEIVWSLLIEEATGRVVRKFETNGSTRNAGRKKGEGGD